MYAGYKSFIRRADTIMDDRKIAGKSTDRASTSSTVESCQQVPLEKRAVVETASTYSEL